MALSDCHPTDYACRIANSGVTSGVSGIIQSVTGMGPSDAVASEWWKIVAGVVIMAVLVDYSPRIGGWILLLVVIGLALSPQARSVIIG